MGALHENFSDKVMVPYHCRVPSEVVATSCVRNFPGWLVCGTVRIFHPRRGRAPWLLLSVTAQYGFRFLAGRWTRIPLRVVAASLPQSGQSPSRIRKLVRKSAVFIRAGQAHDGAQAAAILAVIAVSYRPRR